MAAPDPFAEMSDFSLAPRAPSIHGTARNFTPNPASAEVEAITDIAGDRFLGQIFSGRYFGRDRRVIKHAENW